ncbi:MAG: hypothetical protein JFR41_10890 [Muribaculaceae bacterium]|nr:hypothetical protein [Muribaculaceae bacterium]
MPRNLITFVDSPQIHLENILLVMEKVTFGKDLAAKIVGGVKKLEGYIASGEIAAEKRASVQNGKWYCNAADVLRHCRKMRK